MGARKTPPTAEERAKIAVTLTGRTLTAEHRAKISAANKGRRLTMQDRVRRSLKAMEDRRGEKLNQKLRDDPALAARTRLRRQEGQRLTADKAREERAVRAEKPACRASLSNALRMQWASSGKRRAPNLTFEAADGQKDY